MRRNGEEQFGQGRFVAGLFIPICAVAATAASAQNLPPPGGGEGGGDPPVTAFISPPAEQWAVTPGGVDARTGQYAYSQTDLAIGASGGFSLTRIPMTGVLGHINPFGNFSHNWSILLTEKRVDIPKGNYDNGSGQDYRMQVSFGGKIETFESPYYSSGFSHVSRSDLATLSFPPATDRASSGVVYSFRSSDGTLYTFRAMGSGDCSSETRCAYVSQVEEPDGTLLSFQYDNPSSMTNGARLRSVSSTKGYALIFEYGGPLPYVISAACAINLAHTLKPVDNICPIGALRSTYSYTDSGVSTRLTSATDAAGAIWSFGYSSGPNNAQYMSFTRPGESVPWLVNNYSGGVSQDMGAIYVVYGQSFATGESYNYEYDSPPSAELPGSIIAGGRYTDALGRVTILEYAFPRRPNSLNPPGDPLYPGHEMFGDAYYQVTPGPVRIVDPLGRTTTADYCDPYLIANLPPTDILFRCVVTRMHTYTDPGGIKTDLELAGNGLPTMVRRTPASGSGLPPIEEHATYACASPKSCAKPATLTDAKGAMTHFTYSIDHGGVLTKMDPAPVAGGSRPLTVKTYVQKHAYVKNSGGSLVPASMPVWKPATETICQTVSGSNPPATCDSSMPQMVTVYEYGANGTADNLLLRGIAVTADGQTLRTCYGYDALGRRISETKPAANLSVCP